MNKYNFIMLLTLVFLLTGCNLNETLEFDESLSFVAFDSKTGSVTEARINKDGEAVTNILKIPVTVAVPSERGAITVNFDFSIEDVDNPAVENVDFKLLNESKTLTFPQGLGTQYIEIETINDDEFRKDKTVNIVLKDNSASLALGSMKVFKLVVVDDDHPFGWLIGDYSASGIEMRAGQQTWNMKISGVSGDIYSFKIFGMTNVGPYPTPITENYAVMAKYDEESNQLKIEVGQEFASYGFGPIKLEGYYGPDGDKKMKDGERITCEIVRDNSKVVIKVQDEYAFLITEGNNEGLHIAGIIGDGESVETTWTKK